MGIKSCTVESHFFKLPMEMKYWFKKLGSSRNQETERRETTFGLSYQEVWKSRVETRDLLFIKIAINGHYSLVFFFSGIQFLLLSNSHYNVLVRVFFLKTINKILPVNESGLSWSFESHVFLIFTPIINVLHCGWIISVVL